MRYFVWCLMAISLIWGLVNLLPVYPLDGGQIARSFLSMTDPRNETKLFHGWKLIGALSLILFFAVGGSVYVFPVFIASFQEEFGWSMTQISGGAALFAIVMGLSNPLVGTLFARWGAQIPMPAGQTVSRLLGRFSPHSC